jgi:hypothetical protein
MVLKASLLIASSGNKTIFITVATRRSPAYKYLFHSPLETISHSFSSSLPRLRFPSLVLCFPTMEGKRGIKRKRSPSVEVSPAASDAKTPPSAPSGTPSPPRSSTEVSSRCPRSPVLEQGGPSGAALVIDLSSSSVDEAECEALTNDAYDAAHEFTSSYDFSSLAESKDNDSPRNM